MTLIITSFLAGILTILAPCVLPILPVILAGSLSEKKWWYPYLTSLSLAVSVVVFTVLLKASTFFIDIPPCFWKYFTGIILCILGLFYAFPHVWALIGEGLHFSKSNASLEKVQDVGNPLFRSILTGAALGPVFSSCSPTYLYLIATVFPASFLGGVSLTSIYALGLVSMLLLVTIGGRNLIRKFQIFSSENGIFRRTLGIILVLVGMMIVTGLDKKIEAGVLSRFDVSSLENMYLMPYISSPKNTMQNTTTSLRDTPQSGQSGTGAAYFAGGCFWCMEGIFEAQFGVVEAIAGYAGGEAKDANYDTVSSGQTKHREAVKVVYDPSKISFASLVDLFYTQIDPTQTDGQFADIGFRYTTAAYYQNEEEKNIIETAKKNLEASKKYDKPIAVETVPFTTFFPAEEYHQDYYKKSAFRYNLYKKGSGRAGFIEEHGRVGETLGQYREYDETILSTLKDKKILLFFHADWCPTCRNFDKQIAEMTLPPDVIIFKVDYDSATELKTKYSIVSQSTWIQIDTSGKMYKRWLGKSNLQDILDETLSSKDIIEQKLTPLQFEVTQMGGTEKPFENEYWNNHEAGIYVDIVDGTPLFSSLDKFDSGTGWPSFTRPIDEALVSEHNDDRYGMSRTEVKSKGGSHLGHVFEDGPSGSGGLRYCINSAALRFVPLADLEKDGYGKYNVLFEK